MTQGERHASLIAKLNNIIEKQLGLANGVPEDLVNSILAVIKDDILLISEEQQLAASDSLSAWIKDRASTENAREVCHKAFVNSSPLCNGE